MPITYPAPPPVLSGDVLEINRFLQSPTLITRRLRTLAEQRFIADAILQGRFRALGGAVVYEQNESIYPLRTAQSVAPGGEYPLTSVGTGPAQVASVVKWGQDALITDEAIKRLLIDPVNRALTKLVNGMVKQVDSVALSAIASSITQTFAVTTAWNATSGTITIFRDIMRARAVITALNQGYEPDTLVVDDETFAYVMSDPTVTNAMRREDIQNPIYTGDFPVIAGLRVLPTSNSPTPGVPLIVDSTLLGGMADEALGGPGYTGAVQGVEAKTMRDDEEDQYRLRCRRVTVPVVIEPASGIRLTGAMA